MGICDSTLRSAGSTAPYLIKQLSVWDQTGGGGGEGGARRILMAELPPLAGARRQTEE